MGEYLKRKIDKTLDEWLQNRHHSPALVYGIRQCGKSRSILEFAKSHFQNVNLINFWKTPDIKHVFDDSLEVDDIIRKLSFRNTDFKFTPGKSILILDEIQDCPRARLALKSFKEDKRFEVIASGSYIGLNIVQSGDGAPRPNGSEDIFCRKTLDFEEFLWAAGFSEEQVEILLGYFHKKEKIPDIIHAKLKSLYKEYRCVGGYPEAVKQYFDSNDFSLAWNKNKSLLFDIKGDPIKRKDSQGKSIYSATEISRIQKAFDLVLSSAFSEKSNFIASKIAGNGYQRQDAIDYLLNAGVIFKANNVENPSIPLVIKKIQSQFRLYYSDIGMMTTLCGLDTIRALRQDKLGRNKGPLFEAAVADSLYKADIPVYYFAKSSGLEVDFVISYQGYSTLIEVKAKSGTTRSSKTIRSHPEHYGETKLIKFGDYNIGCENNMLTLPYYLAFALGKEGI